MKRTPMLPDEIFKLVCENYKNGQVSHPEFLRFLADQYEAADYVKIRQEKIYKNRDPEESALWCSAHHRCISIEFMFDDAYRCMM